MLETLWQYALVYLSAATPLLEVMVVIPASVAVGLHPVPVGILAFAGNATTLVAAILGGDELIARLRHRRRHRRAEGASGEDGTHRSERSERRQERIRKIAYRWGLPGVAVLGPITVGSHVAALAAVALRMPRGRVIVWTVGGVAAWSMLFTVLSAVGSSLI